MGQKAPDVEAGAEGPSRPQAPRGPPRCWPLALGRDEASGTWCAALESGCLPCAWLARRCRRRLRGPGRPAGDERRGVPQAFSENPLGFIRESVNWTYYPRWQSPPTWIHPITSAFTTAQSLIDTSIHANISNEVLRILRPRLVELGFEVESAKTREGTLYRPVFFGENGEPERQYRIDAYHPAFRVALEIEAGRSIGGNAIYRDLIQMSLLVDVDYAAVAVPLQYRFGSEERQHPTQPYRHCRSILEAIYGAIGSGCHLADSCL
jgi:hypothetical protein